jgi:hypothetical protein
LCGISDARSALRNWVLILLVRAAKAAVLSGKEKIMNGTDNTFTELSTINQLATLFQEPVATIYRILRRTEEKTPEERTEGAEYWLLN